MILLVVALSYDWPYLSPRLKITTKIPRTAICFRYEDGDSDTKFTTKFTTKFCIS